MILNIRGKEIEVKQDSYVVCDFNNNTRQLYNINDNFIVHLTKKALMEFAENNYVTCNINDGVYKYTYHKPTKEEKLKSIEESFYTIKKEMSLNHNLESVIKEFKTVGDKNGYGFRHSYYIYVVQQEQYHRLYNCVFNLDIYSFDTKEKFEEYINYQLNNERKQLLYNTGNSQSTSQISNIVGQEQTIVSIEFYEKIVEYLEYINMMLRALEEEEK